MVVLALGVDQLAETARAINLAHRVAVRTIAARFGHLVLHAGLRDRLDELRGVLDRAPRRGDRGHHVLVMPHDFHAVPRVTRRVRRDEDRLDALVEDELLERLIGLVAATRPHQPGASLGDQVADGDDLDVRVILEAELGAELTRAETDDAEANPLVRECIQVGVITCPPGIALDTLSANQPAHDIAIGVEHANRRNALPRQ